MGLDCSLIHIIIWIFCVTNFPTPFIIFSIRNDRNFDYRCIQTIVKNSFIPSPHHKIPPGVCTGLQRKRVIWRKKNIKITKVPEEGCGINDIITPYGYWITLKQGYQVPQFNLPTPLAPDRSPCPPGTRQISLPPWHPIDLPTPQAPDSLHQGLCVPRIIKRLLLPHCARRYHVVFCSKFR